MVKATGGSASASRGAGWTILGAVGLIWVALAVWVTGESCELCDFFGKDTIALFVWFVSLSLVPLAAWFLAAGYTPDGEARVSSAPGSVAAKVLYLFSAGMFWLAIYAAGHLVVSIGRLVSEDRRLVYAYLYRSDTSEEVIAAAGFTLVWCTLIGLVTFVATRKLDGAVTTTAASPLVWVGASVIALTGFVVGVAGWVEIDRRPYGIHEFYEQHDRPDYFDDYEPIAPPEPTIATVSPSPGTSPRPVLGFLPVTVNHERSGYRIYDPRVAIRAARLEEGNAYKIVFSGVWTTDGKPGQQRCDYTFLDRNDVPVLIRNVGFSFGQTPRVFQNFNHITLYDSDMSGKPARAKMNCYDER